MFGNNCTDHLFDFQPRGDDMVVDVQNVHFAQFSERDLEKMLERLRAYKGTDSHKREIDRAKQIEDAEKRVQEARDKLHEAQHS